MTYVAMVVWANWLYAVTGATPILRKVDECSVDLRRIIAVRSKPTEPHPLTYLLDVL